MPLYRYEVSITTVHRAVYQVGSTTGIMAIEAGQHGSVKPIEVGLADILAWEADLSTLAEIETEAESQALATHGKFIIPLKPEELAELLEKI